MNFIGFCIYLWAIVGSILKLSGVGFMQAIAWGWVVGPAIAIFCVAALLGLLVLSVMSRGG